MQKVVGSSPIIRSIGKPRKRGVFTFTLGSDLETLWTPQRYLGGDGKGGVE